jgi:hypothetical protein
MPALYERVTHYVTFRNLVDEFDSPEGPYVLVNLDLEINEDALKPFQHLYKFYRRVMPTLRAESEMYEDRGRYWLRTRFEKGRLRATILNRAGLLCTYDENYRPAGTCIAPDRLRAGQHHTTARVTTRRLGMTFGIDDLGFTAEYRRDGDAIGYRSRMNRVPNLVAPPVIHEMVQLIAGEFMRVLAEGNGGLTAAFGSRALNGQMFHLEGAFSGEFHYSPALELLARVGDAIADAHNRNVRADERRLGEELFVAFLKDFRNARERMLALDAATQQPES